MPRQNPLRPRGVVSRERHARPAYVNILGQQTMAYAAQASTQMVAGFDKTYDTHTLPGAGRLYVS
ncbi:hypothetical protein EMIT043CA1_180094 [Pseudomonas brassicacearum]